MDINLNSALNDMADDGQPQEHSSAAEQALRQAEQQRIAEQRSIHDQAERERQAREQAQREQAQREEQERLAHEQTAQEQAQQVSQRDEHVAPMAAAAATVGAQAAAGNRPAPVVHTEPATQPAARANGSSLNLDEPERPTKRRGGLIAAGTGLAILGLVGAAMLLPDGDKGTVAASPSPMDQSLKQTTPQASSTPTEKPAPARWAWTGTDPAATLIPAEQVNGWCKVGPQDQIVSRDGGEFFPGSTALVGPKGTRVPTRQPYPAGWRTCQLGYHQPPTTKPIAFNELRDNDAALKKACAAHSGFNFDGSWKVLNADTRRLPFAQNNNDGSVALQGPGGWIADCEMSVGSPTASLTFSEPNPKDTTCPRATAVSMDKLMPPPPPMGKDGKMPPPPPGFPKMPSPEEMGNMYWITAFGQVPDVKDLRKKAHHGTYQVGNGTEGDSELIIKNGFAVANHTWLLPKGDPTNTKPTLNFYDKAGKKLYSCTAS